MALLITPSSDYAYLLGYHPPKLERLTCLIVPAEGAPSLVVPRLEEPLARHELGELVGEIDILPWDETDDPFSRVGRRLSGGTPMRVAVQDQMDARFVLRLRAALDPVELVEAGPTMAALRRLKTADEIDRLRAASAAADEAMLVITDERLSGRSEAQVSAHVRELLLEAGHQVADFAIVASGPNAASPHHEPGARLIGPGDAVVLDIGGTRDDVPLRHDPHGLRRASRRREFAALYAVLRAAQAAACDGRHPGRSRPRRRSGRPPRHRRGRLRRGVHPSHRPRHRHGDPRGAIHRRAQRRAAPSGRRLQHRAGDLRRWPMGRSDRGHRGLHRRRRRAAEHHAATCTSSNEASGPAARLSRARRLGATTRVRRAPGRSPPRPRGTRT